MRWCHGGYHWSRSSTTLPDPTPPDPLLDGRRTRASASATELEQRGIPEPRVDLDIRRRGKDVRLTIEVMK